MIQLKRLFLGLYSLFPALSYAVTTHKTSATGFGGVALNLLDPITILTNFVDNAALVIGVAFIFGSFIKYLNHRKNPLAVPLSGVIYLLVFGIMLVSLPLAYRLFYVAPPYKP